MDPLNNLKKLVILQGIKKTQVLQQMFDERCHLKYYNNNCRSFPQDKLQKIYLNGRKLRNCEDEIIFRFVFKAMNHMMSVIAITVCKVIQKLIL